MKIQTLSLHPYEIPLTTGQIRAGVLIKIIDELGNCGSGDIAPLPKWSRETLEEALTELNLRKQKIIEINWNSVTCLEMIRSLSLLPSVTFGLESAILSLLAPLSTYQVASSALFMGSPQEILQQAKLRQNEGYKTAKLKVSNLTYDEAASLIDQLKNIFHLRIDVNRAWTTVESLHFFSQFPLDTFDYVEEPFQNPQDLMLFKHPLAVDESFPHDLSLTELALFPTLKALIYKPTIQGGITGCMPLVEWTRIRGVELVLSSSFESNVGLENIACMAHRLGLSSPIGIGTYHFLTNCLTV